MTTYITSTGHQLEMRRQEIDVTSLYRPDTSWKYKDKQGHMHFWWEQDESGEFIPAREYDPAKNYVALSLKYVVDVPESDDYLEKGHNVCIECGERIRPQYTADSVTQYIAGQITCYCDGKQIDREMFEKLVRDERGQEERSMRHINSWRDRQPLKPTRTLHLTDKDLSLYAEGRYDEINLPTVVDHLNFCPRCYAIVHDTRETLREMSDNNNKETES